MKIRIDDLSKSYGDVLAVNELTASIAQGRVTALVGPNGAGKSTLLRLMSGREEADSGEIFYDGISLNEDMHGICSRIGLMPDSLPESWTWKVADYLDYFARCQGLTGQKRHDNIAAIVEFIHIGELQNRMLSALSKGQKQRVSLARVLLGEPEILLLDEPAAGLDPGARVELREDIAKLSKMGKTIVISSHILAELDDICDDALILDKGCLCYCGPIRTMELDPQDQRLALAFSSDVPPQVLASLPHFKTSTPDGDRRVIVTLDGAPQAVDTFMAGLFEAHLPLESFSRQAQSLEKLFLEKTKGQA